MGNHTVECRLCGEDLRGLSGGHAAGCDGVTYKKVTASPPYVLVPREATEEMTRAWQKESLRIMLNESPFIDEVGPAYIAMLSARPESSSKLQQAQEEVTRCAKKRIGRGLHTAQCTYDWGDLTSKCNCGEHELMDALASLSAAEGES